MLLCDIYKKIKKHFYSLRYRVREFWYSKLNPILNPQNSRYRAVIPKTWLDVDCLMENVNFEFIKGFYEDEFLQSAVDWNYNEKHKKFALWLKKSYKYLTVKRPELELKIENSYPKELPELLSTRKKIYSKIEKLEKELFDRDTQLLKEFVEYRKFFWT
jgi:hypothetical protein